MLKHATFLTIALIGALAAGPAWADHDDHGKGHGKGGKHGHKERVIRTEGRNTNINVHVDVHIGEPQRVVVRDYYVTEIRAGHCPPGLAKKHNGCMPPGQAKKKGWIIGRPLPREVIFYELPPPLVVQLGPPPGGYRYVRVANDVLLIAIGSGMVMDAIADLGRM